MEPLLSTYADDEDMAELVEMFVSELPERKESLQKAASDKDVDQLRVLSHQLKGSAGSYGFQPITDAAAELENAIKADAEFDVIQTSLDALVELIDRASLTNAD